MRRTDLDHMLEVAVAKAIGVRPPHLRTATRPLRKAVQSHRVIRRAA